MLDVCGIIGTKRWHKIGTVRGTERPLRGASDYRLDRNRVGIAFPVELRISGLISIPTVSSLVVQLRTFPFVSGISAGEREHQPCAGVDRRKSQFCHTSFGRKNFEPERVDVLFSQVVCRSTATINRRWRPALEATCAGIQLNFEQSRCADRRNGGLSGASSRAIRSPE